MLKLSHMYFNYTSQGRATKHNNINVGYTQWAGLTASYARKEKLTIPFHLWFSIMQHASI